MACSCGQHNMHSDWLIVGHYSPIIPTGSLWTYKNKAKMPNKLLTSSVWSLHDNVKPWPCSCWVNMAKSRSKIFPKDLTFGQQVLINDN